MTNKLPFNNRHQRHNYFPGGSDSKESTCNAGDPGFVPGLGRYPGGKNGNPLQYSCLENPMDGGAWWATAHGIAKSWPQLSDFTFIDTIGLPRWLSGKESACSAGDLGSIPGSGRCPGDGNGNPLQYSCLENPMDRGAWQATVHGVAKSRTRLSAVTDRR